MAGQKSSGGRGGRAYVEGNNSNAEGGRGGEAGIGDGGQGGDATVKADNSKAIGGSGGRGGIGPGGRGGDALIGENSVGVFVVGGQGGEASQQDGRGGRGGRAYIPSEMRGHLGLPDRAHMRWPYFEPVTEYGRGGDAPDTPQYMARRLIVEQLKKRYFALHSFPLNQVWWDRQLTPIDWINERLEAEGHRWRVSVVADEYEFSDVLRKSETKT